MQADDPPFLPVGTDVSAKYKGAFCEAKIKKVVRNIKCKVTFKAAGAGSTTVSDDVITGTLRVGNTVEVKVDQKKELLEANIIKIQDCSQYTVVFDDGDITTLRRSALCLKSGRHFAESETLDQLPLTHPEHFGNPVIGASGRRGRRTNRTQSDDSDSEASEWAGGSSGQGAGLSTAVTEREPHAGRVVLVQCSTGDKKRAHHSHQWFPGLVVAPNAQDTVKIKVKDDYLVRSFKDGRYYTVPKKEAREFRRNSVSTEWSGMDAAILYLDKNILPPHWDREILFGQESQSQSDEIDSDDSMDDEPHEEKDHFVAQLYKFMDDRGTPLNKQPAIAAKDINLYRLFNVVQKLGGYNKVTNQNQWKKIAQRLGFVPATPSVSNLCRQAYKKYLHSFEEFYRKLGVTLLSFPRSGRTAGRSLIRDRDKMHSSYSQKSASPAPANTNTVSEEKTSESTSNKVSGVKGKDKDTDKEGKKEKESKTKDVDVKIAAKEKDTKEKETKELKEKEPKSAEKEKDVKVKEKIRETKEKEVKEKDVKEKTKDKENNSKSKQKETKIKIEPIASSEEDSGDNQPLAPLSIKPEKIEPSIAVEKPIEKSKSVETPVKTSKIFKSSSGTIDGKKTEKGSSKKITHRRNSLPRCTSTGSKSDTFTKAEARCKSSSSDSSTTTKKQLVDSEKNKDKDSSFSTTSAKKHVSSSDKNDSDSSSRGSKNGKIPSRRNLTPNESTPPSTPSSSSSQHKKPRKRKITEPSDTTTPIIHADVGDKLKVYYGPTHSESKVTYEAKVIEIDGKGTETLLRVHYTGWNTRYDEWIKPSRIADNLTQHSKNKHKDKGKRSSASSGPPESTTSKKSRTSQPSSVTSSPVTSKPHTRNRVSNNNTSTPNQAITESSIQSESESDLESDSSEQRQQKKISDDNKSSTSEKVLSESPTITSEKPLEKTPDSANKEKSKISKIPKTPQIKRNAEGSQNRVKRTRLKQEDNISPRGRDYDLNEIRSELKGLDTTLKTPVKDVKIETTIQTTVDEIKISYKQEKTPEKVTEDIYEFKEPEPFEFEARKSEEKKKRLPPHRIFDDIPPLKLSPNASPEKPVIQEPEKTASKTHYEIVFDKLYRIDSIPPVEESNIPVEKEGEALSLFCELGGEDSADKFVISEAEDSEEPLFTYQPELFPEKPYIPIFKGFTPAKNQETYSKKDAASKIRDIEDDFTNSPIKGEQSSDEDPIDAAIQRVNTQTMSDDSNDVDLLIKTPSTPTAPSVGLLPTFTSDTSIDTSSKEVLNVEITDIQQKSKLEVLLKLQTEPVVVKSTPQDVIVVHKKDFVADVPSEPKAIALMEVSETSLEIKNESDNTPSFADVVMPEPPAGFLLHKEGPSIAEKVLRALSSAKRASTPPITKEPAKLSKPDPVKSIKSILPKNPTLKVCVTNIQPTIISPETVPSQVSMDTEQATAQPVQKLDQIKTDIKIDTQRKDTNTILPDPPPKPDLVTTKSETPLSSIKKDAIERRKSVAEPALGGKSNKVLSETIQKLSSQISQPTPALSIPEYPNDDRSDTTDSDDSDSRLIIDKLSEEESQSCISLSENSTSQPLKAQVDKSNMPWSSNVDSNQDTDHEKSCNIPDLSTKDSIPKQPEEDSNISLLLCEETIPGSPAPENLGEAAKNASKSRTRNLEIPFASAPSISPDQASKEPSTHKDVPRERDIPRELREAGLSARNERECHGGNNPTADTVMDNTPPTTPESSIGNISPNRDQQLSDVENQCDMKIIDEDPVLVPSKKMNEIDKSSSASNVRNSAPNSPGTGPRRGRRPRGCRLSDSEDQSALTSLSHSNSHRQLKYNFCVEFDPLLDGAARIALITSRLSELRKVYHSLKAELATIDRRRKKLRRKEREAIKAAKAACS